MHAFKGAWAGQTFALATYNEAGGKKTRIRRSKEERKTLVEMFIKRYQKSNDGNFPSLNLTHKEVGGSFYTVREIVREIIQENRVLGPAKLDLEEQNIDILLENLPLGTMSVEPKESLSSLSETQTTSLIQGVGEEFVEQELNGNARKVYSCTKVDKSVSMGEPSYPDVETSEAQQPHLVGQLTRSDLQTSDGILVDEGTQINHEDEESNATNLGNPVSVHHDDTSQEHVQEASEEVPKFDDHNPEDENLNFNQQAINVTSQATEEIEIASLNVEKDGRKQLEESNSLQTPVNPDILVEKFPLRPVSKKSDGLKGTSEVHHQETETLEVNEIEQDRLHVTKDASSLMNEELSADISSEQVKDDEAVDETTRSKVLSSSLGSSNSSTIQKTEDPQLRTKVSSPQQSKTVNSLPAFSGNVNKMKSSSLDKNLPTQDSVGVKYKLNIEHKNTPQEGVESRFERVKLETEKGVSQKSASSEISPLLAFFQSMCRCFRKILG